MPGTPFSKVIEAIETIELHRQQIETLFAAVETLVERLDALEKPADPAAARSPRRRG